MTVEYPNEVTMMSGQTWRVGQRVRVFVGHGRRPDTIGEAEGTIGKIRTSSRSCPMFYLTDLVLLDGARYGAHEQFALGHPAPDGRTDFNVFRDHGVSGGCLRSVPSPLDTAPRCPTCDGMLSGDTRQLKCIPAPPNAVLEPEEWSAGCGTVLEWIEGRWVTTPTPPTTPTQMVRPGHWHWVAMRGPGTESTHDHLEVMLPYFNEHGQLIFWERCGTSAELPPERIARVISVIPFPEE